MKNNMGQRVIGMLMFLKMEIGELPGGSMYFMRRVAIETQIVKFLEQG